MRFSVYLTTCAAAFVAHTQAANIKINAIADVPAEVEADTEAKASTGIYLEIDTDAQAEAEAYMQAGIESGNAAEAYAESL